MAVSAGAIAPSPTTPDAATWRNFVAASPSGDILQCLEWGAIKKPQWQPVPVALRESGHIDGAALALRRALPRTGRSILYVPRGPIVDWSKPAELEALVKSLRESARQQRAILLKIDPAVPDGTPGVVENLRRLGFVPSPDAVGGFGGTQPRCVMKLSLEGSQDDVMGRFHQKWRYNIRLAERKGIKVTGDCKREDLAIFHELYRVTAERDGFTGRPLAYFQKMWDALVEPGLARLFITSFEGQPLSAAICFILPPQCWYVYGASSNEHRNLMPNHAMQWEMIRWAKERGCNVYDFRGVHNVAPSEAGSAPVPLIESPDGLVRFKAGFGAELIEYVGEWDLPLHKNWYWLWTTGRPKLVGALKRLKRR